MSDPTIRVPWTHGREVLPASLRSARRPMPSRADRCAAKRAQIERDLTVLTHADAIAFQARRLMWLAWAETAPADVLEARRKQLQTMLGPERLEALRTGLLAGETDPIVIRAIAELVLYDYAIGATR